MVTQISIQSPGMKYTVYQKDRLPSPISLQDAVNIGLAVELHLPQDSSFVPLRMEAYGPAEERDRLPDRICLLAANRSLSRTFTLPRRSGKEQGASGDKGGE